MSTTHSVSTVLLLALLGYGGAVSARFIQPDPLGEEGGVNLYAYVGNDPLNRIDPYGLIDIIYSAGPLGRSNPFIANPQAPGRNYLVAGPYGEAVPMGAGVFQRTVVQGRPFDAVYGATQTSALIDWGRGFIQSNRLLGASGTPSLPEVAVQSLPGRPWDTKQFLPATSVYMVNQKAELRDYVGNTIWGAGLNALGVPQSTALRGAQAQGGWSGGEDPRDQEAIRFGYTLPAASGSTGARGK